MTTDNQQKFLDLKRFNTEQIPDLLKAGLEAVGGPFLTVNEMRNILNLPQISGKDSLLLPANK